MAEVTIKEIKEVIDEGFEKQAVLINNAFQTHSDHFDQRLGKVESKVDKLATKLELDEVKTAVQRVEAKVDKALHTEYKNLEVRVKKLEQHTGFKTA